MRIQPADTEQSVRACFPVVHQLRPHLDMDGFLAAVEAQREEGYRLACLEDDGEVRAVAGYRVQHSLWRGRFLYVDDLITHEDHRSKGYGTALVDWLKAQASQAGCRELRLDSGTQRADAHRFYEREGLEVRALHFAIEL